MTFDSVTVAIRFGEHPFGAWHEDNTAVYTAFFVVGQFLWLVRYPAAALGCSHPRPPICHRNKVVLTRASYFVEASVILKCRPKGVEADRPSPTLQRCSTPKKCNPLRCNCDATACPSAQRAQQENLHGMASH